MIAQQLDILAQMLQQTRPNISSKKDNSNDSFKDMFDSKKQENTAAKKEPVKDKTSKQPEADKTKISETEVSDTEDIAAKQALLANLLFAQSITPVQNEMSQQNTDLLAGQILQPIIEDQIITQNVSAMGDIQQNITAVSDQEISIMPEMTEQTGEFAVQIENIESEQSNAEVIQPKIADEVNPELPKVDENIHKPTENEVSKDGQPEIKQSELSESTTPIFQNIESTPIKVGEKAPVLDTESPNMEQNLKEIIQYNLKTDGDKIEIQLNPSNLGKITIELAQKDNGMAVLVSVENSKTLSILAQHASGIENIIQERLSQPVNVLIEQQQPEQQFDDAQKQNNQQNQNNQNNKQNKDEQQNFIDQLRLGLYNLD